ncbi:MAG: hypothetical protein M0024_11310 [Nitrospiraceae bacterium]|nr:hypothetical protein [Nitrospiraceae bacterium]
MRLSSDSVYALTIALFCAVVMLSLQLHGRQGRVFLHRPEIAAIDNLGDALAVWQKSGISGRTLLIFSRTVGDEQMDRLVPPAAYPVNDATYVYLAVKKNIVRKVYHVLNDKDWAEAADILARYSSVARSGESFRSGIEDVPLIITKLRDLDHLDEPVLILIDTEYIGAAAVHRIADSLKNRGICGDFVIFSGKEASAALKQGQEFTCGK